MSYGSSSLRKVRTVTFDYNIQCVRTFETSHHSLTVADEPNEAAILKLNKLNILLIRRWLIKKEEELSKAPRSFSILSTQMH